MRYFTTLRELTGTKEDEIEIQDGANLIDLVKKIVSEYGSEASDYLYVEGTKEIDPSIQFLINGISQLNLEGIKTKLVNGDIVAIIPPVGGG
jgi:MoaD family protein